MGVSALAAPYLRSVDVSWCKVVGGHLALLLDALQMSVILELHLSSCELKTQDVHHLGKTRAHTHVLLIRDSLRMTCICFSCSVQARLSFLSPGVGRLLQRLCGWRWLGCSACSRRPGLSGRCGLEPPTFDLCLLLRLAPRSPPRSASTAGADSAGSAAMADQLEGPASAEPLAEKEESPAGLGSRLYRCNISHSWRDPQLETPFVALDKLHQLQKGVDVNQHVFHELDRCQIIHC